MLQIRFFLLFSAIHFSLFGQLPQTDIWLLDMKAEFVSEKNTWNISFSNARNITANDGYDNQPWFMPGGNSLLFTSGMDGRQTDIFQYDCHTGETRAVLKTDSMSEFSPQLDPESGELTCVQVQDDGVAQLFVQYSSTGERKVLSESNAVGYYTWLGKKMAAVFVLGKPETLQLTRWEHGAEKRVVLANSAGRCMQRAGSSDLFYYIDKSDSLRYQLNLHNTSYQVSKPVLTMPSKSEDFCSTTGNFLLMGYEEKLYRYYGGSDADWVLVADFSNTPYSKFYRIAVNEQMTRMAIVTYAGEKP